MESISVKPEKELRVLWILEWVMTFIIITVGGIVCYSFLRYPANLILGLTFAFFDLCLILNLIWIPAFYKTLEYTIGDDSIFAKKGVFWRKTVTVPYPKITNVDVTQGPLQRMFNIGTVHIQTAGASATQTTSAELKMMGIRDFHSAKDAIMERLKAYSSTTPAAPQGKPAASDETTILNAILEELKSIRGILEDK